LTNVTITYHKCANDLYILQLSHNGIQEQKIEKKKC